MRAYGGEKATEQRDGEVTDLMSPKATGLEDGAGTETSVEIENTEPTGEQLRGKWGERKGP